MRKGTVFGLLLSVLCLIGLGFLTAYLTIEYKDDAFSTEASQVEKDADAVLVLLQQAATTEAPKKESTKESKKDSKKESANETLPDSKKEKTEEKAETEAKTDTKKETKKETPKETKSDSKSSAPSVIWVGDSRTVGMGHATNDSDVYIGKDGEGYEWFNEKGRKTLKKAMTENPNTPVVFNLGVNDCDNIDNYLELYKKIVDKYPDTHFYFMAVNPIEPTLCENVTNEEISAFNARIKEAFPDQFIDSFTFIQVSEIVTNDGIHYSDEDYQRIHDFVSTNVKSKESVA